MLELTLAFLSFVHVVMGFALWDKFDDMRILVGHLIVAILYWGFREVWIHIEPNPYKDKEENCGSVR